MDLIERATQEGRRTLSENERIKEIDINPLILSGSQPVAVDALVVLG